HAPRAVESNMQAGAFPAAAGIAFRDIESSNLRQLDSLGVHTTHSRDKSTAQSSGANMARVMVVEDEGVVARDIARLLSSLGHEVAALVQSGAEAITRADANPPDLILMDIRLKDALDGVDTATQIRAARDIPVIFLTGLADVATLDRVRRTHAYAYVLKPFTD